MRTWPIALLPAAALACLEACDRSSKAAVTGADASTTSAEVDGSLKLTAGDASAEVPADRRLVLKLGAASFVASVSDTPDWPENDAGARRLGYLRNGAIVSAYDPPVSNEECKDGWYELVEGGYVCGKHATIDLTNPRVSRAPKQPDLDAGMPYRYGVNVSDGTPLYRRVLNAEDRRKYESYGGSPKAKEEKPEGEAEGEAKDKDEEPPLAATEDEPSPPRRHHGHEKGDKLKDPFRHLPDGGRPHLKDLKGRGVLVRKLARGFTIALDRDFKGANARWWRTTFGFAVPFERVALQGGVARHAGNWFTGDGAKADLLPFPEIAPAEALASDAGVSLAGTVGFVTSGGARKLEIGDDGKGGLKVGWGTELPRKSAVLLTGREATVSGVTYQEASGGFWVRLAELRIAKPNVPADVGPDERWIDVDLTRQQLVAFEGRKPVFATLISSGRRNLQDKEHDFPTPAGTFRVREKHVTATMDADVASDGPYSIEDVPWVMYFQGSYALHGAFWHDSFGYQRSHGCVNLAPDDARTLFTWADPQLPAGWHGVFAKDENSGSRVVVHEDPPPKRR